LALDHDPAGVRLLAGHLPVSAALRLAHAAAQVTESFGRYISAIYADRRFRTEPFSTGIISNGNVVALLHPPGRFTVYLNKLANGNWNDFNTFSRGQPIATFEFGTTQDIRFGPVQIGYTSARLIAADDFEFNGSQLNLKDLFPHGVTINFIVNPTPLNTSFPLVISLGFSAIAAAATSSPISSC